MRKSPTYTLSVSLLARRLFFVSNDSLNRESFRRRCSRWQKGLFNASLTVVMLFRLIMFLPKSRRPSLQWGLLNVCGKPAMPSSPMSFESSTKVWSLLLWILRADNNFAAPSSPIWLPSRFKHCKQLGFLIAAAKHLQPLHWIWLWLKSSSRRPQFGLLRLLERLSTPLSPMRLELKFRMMILHSKEVRASAIFSAPAFVMLLPARPKRVIWLCKQFRF